MSEFDENNNEIQNNSSEPVDETSGTPVSGNDSSDATGETEPTENASSNEEEKTVREQEPSGENEPPKAANDWAYSWDGKEQKKKKKNHGSKVFCLVAVICLVLCVAICVPTILMSYKSPKTNETSKETSTSTTTSSESDNASDTSSALEIEETVKPSESAYEETSDYTELYAKCSASCVTIYVTYARSTGYAIGSGFVLTEDGYIATNQHVVDSGSEFTVIFYDGTEYAAELVGEDSIRDLAVLKIDATGLTPLEIGDSDALKIGQDVVAIGTPYDLILAGTMTKGIISGLNRELSITDSYGKTTKTMNVIQTDASINSGNSGGPLINLAGQVVGINYMKINSSSYEGIGFAIPINVAVEIFNQLIQYGEVVQEPSEDFVQAAAYLGVTVGDLSSTLTYYRIHPQGEYPEEGAFIGSVEPSSSVYAAGLRTYDVITEFAGVTITGRSDLTTELAKYKAGETVTMTVFRFNDDWNGGQYITMTFVLDSAS